MTDSKFGKFCGALLNWLDENHNLAVIDKLFFPSGPSSVVEAVPDGGRLWQSYLKAILPPDSSRLFCLNLQFPDNIVDKLLAFNSYVVERKIAEIADLILLKSTPAERRKDLVSRILNFHFNLPKWIEGNWRDEILRDRDSAFNEIKKEIFRSENNWTCALFLSEAGYLYPSSRNSLKAWLKWSGLDAPADGYCYWKDLLKSEFPDFRRARRVDFALDLIFSNDSLFTPSNLCRDLSSCSLCPVKSDCRCLEDNPEYKLKSDVEDLIRADNSGEIGDVDLIKYLAGKLWKGSGEQRSFLENISGPRSGFRAGMEKDDEKFLLFLLGTRELASRLQQTKPLSKGDMITGSRKIFEHLKYKLSRDIQEAFYTLILDNKHRVIRLQLITRGTLTESLVHPREVFAPAIQLRAAAIVLIHNHPGGDVSPSRQDIQTTERLRKVGDMVGIQTLDHVIIGGNKYFSFMDEGLIT